MRRAKRPLNPAAISAANAAVSSLTKPPGRPLDPDSPRDEELRTIWMDTYVRAGGEIDGAAAAAPATGTIAKCPHYIELQYLHVNGLPVKNAKYNLRALALRHELAVFFATIPSPSSLGTP